MYNVQIIEFGGWRRGISEASTTLNARALKARSIISCKLCPTLRAEPAEFESPVQGRQRVGRWWSEP